MGLSLVLLKWHYAQNSVWLFFIYLLLSNDCIHGFMPDCSNSLELSKSCAKPSTNYHSSMMTKMMKFYEKSIQILKLILSLFPGSPQTVSQWSSLPWPNWRHGDQRQGTQGNRQGNILVNKLAPGRCGSIFQSVISEHLLRIKFKSTSCEIPLMPSGNVPLPEPVLNQICIAM